MVCFAEKRSFRLPSCCKVLVTKGGAGLEVYGFHALELYQYHIERRRGAERG